MGGSYPVTREMRRVFQEHIGLYSELGDYAQSLGLSLRPKDAEAKLEFDDLPWGDWNFTFTFPLDDNADPADGRAYLTETIQWDSKRKRLKSISREVTLPNVTLWSPNWKSRLGKLIDPPLPKQGDPRLTALAGDLALARPQDLPQDF